MILLSTIHLSQLPSLFYLTSMILPVSFSLMFDQLKHCFHSRFTVSQINCYGQFKSFGTQYSTQMMSQSRKSCQLPPILLWLKGLGSLKKFIFQFHSNCQLLTAQGFSTSPTLISSFEFTCKLACSLPLSCAVIYCSWQVTLHLDSSRVQLGLPWFLKCILLQCCLLVGSIMLVKAIQHLWLA